MFFGQRLKQDRIIHAEKGPRLFAAEVGMKVSDYLKVENGYEPPPQDEEWLQKVIVALGLEDDAPAIKEYEEHVKEHFVMQKMREDPGVCPLHATLRDGTSASVETLIAVGEHILQIAKEHNKKADIYNAEHRQE